VGAEITPLISILAIFLPNKRDKNHAMVIAY